MTTFRYLITAEDAGDQIQHFLRFKQGISRKVVISLKHLPEGILLNGSHARTIDLLREGDTLEINLPDQARKLPPCEIDVPRLYWDRDVAVFNKPAGMPVHQSGGHIFGTLASVYATLCEKEGNSGTFRAVNRIDKDTSGLVLAAKHAYAAPLLARNVEKLYYAVVEGELPLGPGVIDAPIGRRGDSIIGRCVTPEGKPSRTEYTILRAAQGLSLAACVPVTGRTHQIRVHFASIGHPLAGDWLYGTEDPGLILRPALHSYMLTMTHPVTGELLHFTAPIPADMQALI